MAQAATLNESDIPLIEEQVETGLLQLLASYRPNYTPGGEKKDELIARFTLLPGRSLPEYDHPYAKAFEAVDQFNDQRPIYALVCDNSMPIRLQAINELNAFSHPHLQMLLGAGVVNCSHLSESRYVLFLERPHGIRLSETFRKNTRFLERQVIDLIVGPATKALVAMREKKIHHGHIHPHNFFVSDQSQLAECVSSPCGTQSPYLYEPLERLMADPLGRGEASEKADVYSLGVLAYEALYGLDRLKAIPRETFIEHAIQAGTYRILAKNRDFSEKFQDFFRGTLNENPAERWSLDQLSQWVGGKRFNMIVPGQPKDASRPVMFMNEEFFNRRVLAHTLHVHWRQALKEIKELKIDRWCEMSLHKPELAEKIDRAMRFAGSGSTDTQLNDMLTRVIAILDPTGPLRTVTFSLRPDAIAQLLADVAKHNGPELNQLIAIIDNDLSNYWAEQVESNKTPEVGNAIFRLQKVKPILKKKELGFGLERALYDLNPSLCCQSPLLKPYHVMTAIDALKTLDALAPSLAPNTSLEDRHIAAFIASKIDNNKEIRLHDLENVPALANNQELIMMRLLAKAQQKTPKLPLVGLSAWAGTRIEQMIDSIHNRVIRKRLKLALKRLAQTGNLSEVMTAIINADVSFRDNDGFVKAIALHQFSHERIERLNNEAILQYKARKAGGKMAMIICNLALAATCYLIFINHLDH